MEGQGRPARRAGIDRTEPVAFSRNFDCLSARGCSLRLRLRRWTWPAKAQHLKTGIAHRSYLSQDHRRVLMDLRCLKDETDIVDAGYLGGIVVIGIDEEICKVFGKERGRLRKT